MEQRYLTTADVARELGVAKGTVSAWRSLSRPGKFYADHPFPDPDMVIGNVPVWVPGQLPEIEAWVAARPGSGGARPRKGLPEQA